MAWCSTHLSCEGFFSRGGGKLPEDYAADLSTALYTACAISKMRLGKIIGLERGDINTRSCLIKWEHNKKLQNLNLKNLFYRYMSNWRKFLHTFVILRRNHVFSYLQSVRYDRKHAPSSFHMGKLAETFRYWLLKRKFFDFAAKFNECDLTDK